MQCSPVVHRNDGTARRAHNIWWCWRSWTPCDAYGSAYPKQISSITSTSATRAIIIHSKYSKWIVDMSSSTQRKTSLMHVMETSNILFICCRCPMIILLLVYVPHHTHRHPGTPSRHACTCTWEHVLCMKSLQWTCVCESHAHHNQACTRMAWSSNRDNPSAGSTYIANKSQTRKVRKFIVYHGTTHKLLLLRL